MRTTILILALSTLAACGSDAVTAPSVDGTYTPRTLDGAALPVTTTKLTGSAATITAGNLVLSGGSFTSQLTVQATVNGTVFTQVFPKSGTYTVAQNRLTFVERSDNSTSTSTLDGDTIVATENGLVFTFKRQ